MSHSKIEKTNAARLLDRAKIAYELVPYRVDGEHLAATHVAEQLGEDIATVFKTLVLRGDRTGYFVCVVPGDHEVDLKAAAKVSGNKKADLIPMKELLPVTGYKVRSAARSVPLNWKNKIEYGRKNLRKSKIRVADTVKVLKSVKNGRSILTAFSCADIVWAAIPHFRAADVCSG